MDSVLKNFKRLMQLNTHFFKLDFYLMDGQIKIDNPKRLDVEIRKVVIKAICWTCFPYFFYKSYRDGEISLICFEERKEVIMLPN
jgi:hypothetical protein